MEVVAIQRHDDSDSITAEIDSSEYKRGYRVRVQQHIGTGKFYPATIFAWWKHPHDIKYELWGVQGPEASAVVQFVATAELIRDELKEQRYRYLSALVHQLPEPVEYLFGFIANLHGNHWADL